jgi:hypothetical protein
MLDLYTKEWTDQLGNTTKLSKLEDNHLLNIQRLLKKTLRNPEKIRAQVESSAVAYDTEFSDKDWWFPTATPSSVETDIEWALNQLKVSLILVSQEVNKRKLTPLLLK